MIEDQDDMYHVPVTLEICDKNDFYTCILCMHHNRVKTEYKQQHTQHLNAVSKIMREKKAVSHMGLP